jgi:Protein of unknown function (DUF3017)
MWSKPRRLQRRLLALTPVRLGPVTSPSAETQLTEPVVRAADIVVTADGLAVEVPEVVAVEPHERKGVLRELPLGLIIGGVALGLVVIGLHHFRWGNLLIAGSLLAGAFFRLVLPTRRAGLLAVRSRFTDVVTMSAMGGSLMLLALITST